MNRTIIIVVMFASIWRLPAQGVHAGIYSKAEDLISNHFAFKCNCDSGKVRVSLGKRVTIHQKKTSHSFGYNEVYSYRDCNKKDFRILNKQEFEIINKDEIILYKTENIISKSSEMERHYFFSVSLESRLFALTIQNLKTAYAKSHQLNDLLDEHFKNDEELIRFNKALGKYELVHLLLDARKK